MPRIFKFLLEVNKLRTIKRQGWVWRGVKNSETVAQHTFQVALMSWLLAERARPKLDIENIIKISLVHDLCEVYAGDMTPRWGLVPSDPKERREFLKRRVRLIQQLKKERGKTKFEVEKKSLEKLVKDLPSALKNELMTSWLIYEKSYSKEGRFVKQVDKVEALLQALKYFGTKQKSFSIVWWEEVADYVDHAVLIDFLVEIEKKFYTRKKVNPLLDFFLEVNKLKSLPRKGWVIRKVKEPETIAEHSFTVALMTWVLGKGRNLNLERAMKIALSHEICAVYVGDYTPHDVFGPRFPWKNFWEKPRLLKKEKIKRFNAAYQRETKGLKRLIDKLPKKTKDEILELWVDFNEKKSREGIFVDQINALATLFQACLYWQENKKFPIKTFYEQVTEFVSDKRLIKFLEVMGEKFKLKI